MAIVRYKPQNENHTQPWSMLDQLYREMNSLFEPGLGERGEEGKLEVADWAPAVDIKENESAYQLHVDLPGVDPKQVEVTAEHGVLEIKGDRNSELKESRDGYTRVERQYGRFYRRFTLPDQVDADGIKASAEHGVLTVTIPKAATAKPRRIEVS
ncbi:MAG: Hsp20/alpha crystallin family protein [Halothiobacillaceae bacterium]|nr:Hsp20/alpha crystallin family protein [Halothiobacillaceae bacterium]HER35472.1 Hsp20/alpha crystallin family protein [Halothiobacillaceae bacterium]